MLPLECHYVAEIRYQEIAEGPRPGSDVGTGAGARGPLALSRALLQRLRSLVNRASWSSAYDPRSIHSFS
jgi:hypothetical protein